MGGSPRRAGGSPIKRVPLIAPRRPSSEQCASPLQPGSLWNRSLFKMERAPDYAVGWGTLALINAGVAQGKNRSGLGWFHLSLLLGAIATFILVAFCDKLPPR